MAVDELISRLIQEEMEERGEYEITADNIAHAKRRILKKLIRLAY